MRTSLVSIHDVMPDTLDIVRGMLERLQNTGIDRVTLLVVPGLNWTDSQLGMLAEMQSERIELAGHGWFHRVRHIRGAYHRLHSLMLSRRAAEHLALDRGELQQLLGDCFDWFAEHDLQPPRFYVPPAWAMGALTRVDLRVLPFRYYETLNGIFDSETGRFYRLPLTGYEADNNLRKLSLSLFNSLNLAWSTLGGVPLRIGIHPHDFGYGLSASLSNHLKHAGRCLLPADLV